jgi:endopeptidase Clp ATP-binding regulatory subunit ClpX
MSDKKEEKIPSPDEIKNDIENLIKGKYGSGIKFMGFGPGPGQDPHEEVVDEEIKEPPKKFDPNFDLKPKDIKSYLDRYVIKQDEAKKALAIAVCDHYNHVKECMENPDLRNEDYSKQNVLLMGPTGVGKTYLVKLIAQMLGVPFVKADATRFTETGYVGANVEDLVKDLVRQSGGDIDAAQFGIVYIDEADKLASPPNPGGRDVSGRGVQFGLLKLMEETEVDLKSANDIGSQIQSFMEFQQKGKVEDKVINTRHILFIVSGAFTGILDIIKDRRDHRKIGINSEVKGEGELEADQLLHSTATEDFIKFGFEPEFIGRLPVRVSCEHLTNNDLFKVLTESEGSIIKQYRRSFKSYGITLRFEDEALQEIADQAAKEKTGARALMTVAERALRDYKFELPSMDLKKFIVNKEVIADPSKELDRLLNDKDYLDKLTKFEQIRGFGIEFKAKHGIRIDFTESAVEKLVSKANDQNMEVGEFLKECFTGYEHGLSLIKQNSGKSEFVFDEAVVDQPKKLIEEMIKDSYSQSN